MKRFLTFFALTTSIPLLMLFQGCAERRYDPPAILQSTWQGYKESFIREGRVVRPKDGYDTVSEGQAYAMLRALSADDRHSFDRILRWTEDNLSRKGRTGDHLLSWHYADGKVVDVNSAADADVDYALALVLASRKWNDASYLFIAEKILNDILDHETLSFNGRRYLLPWPLESVPSRIPQNLSYYSPAHFRIFYEETSDARWLELVETGYFLLHSIQRSFEGKNGSGLLPDWCEVGADGDITALPGRSDLYAWEAVRIPLRLAMDLMLHGESRALEALQGFASFFEKEYAEKGLIYSEHTYGGEAENPFEHPLFYTAAFAALEFSGSRLAGEALERVRRYLKEDGRASWYLNEREYYSNSLCWLSELYLVRKKSFSGSSP